MPGEPSAAELDRFHARHAAIAARLMREDRRLTAVEALRRSVPLERRSARRMMRRYVPWPSWVLHAVMVWVTRGAWVVVVVAHLATSYSRLHTERYPDRAAAPRGRSRR